MTDQPPEPRFPWSTWELIGHDDEDRPVWGEFYDFQKRDAMNEPTVIPGTIPEDHRTARVKKLTDLLIRFCLNAPGYEAEVTGLEETGAKNQTRARYLAIQRIIRKNRLPLSVHKRGATLWVRREEAA